jgi:hypothetical protein
MESKPRRKLSIWLSPMHILQFEIDDLQFSGPIMTLYRDGAPIAQFQGWVGWSWQDEKAKLELASVSPIRPESA